MTDYAAQIEQFRREKDRFFRSAPESPLTAEQQRRFGGLRYFPPDPAYRFELPLDPNVDREPLALATSTGETRELRRAGRFTFAVGGQTVQVTAFGEPAEGELFIPFRDRTSGQETYGAGRYLEARRLPDGRWLVDFNLAYNPYCAYNERWSCPLPPPENWLPVRIEAGEQTFAEH